VLAEGREAERRVLAGPAPDLDRIDPIGLRQAAQEPGDVTDLVGMQTFGDLLGIDRHASSRVRADSVRLTRWPPAAMGPRR
jgi:hypothetical protein